MVAALSITPLARFSGGSRVVAPAAAAARQLHAPGQLARHRWQSHVL